MVQGNLDLRRNPCRDDPALMVANSVDDEQDSTFGVADDLESHFIFVAGVAPFQHRAFEDEAGEAEIKPPFIKVAVALGGVPDKILGAKGSSDPAELWWHETD